MLLDKLNWRYATKKMDSSRVVPEAKVAAVLQAVRLAPGLGRWQPFDMVVVDNPQVRAKIRAITGDQSQLVGASHLLVFAAWETYTAERINTMPVWEDDKTDVAEHGGSAAREKRLADGPPRDLRVNFEQAARQACIGLALALTAATFETLVATPMTGFEPTELDTVLDLRTQGLRSVAVLSLGCCAGENGGFAKVKKWPWP